MRARSDSRRLFTVKEAVEAGWYPSEAGLRWLVFNAKENGLDVAIRRINGRVLLDEASWWAWVDEHQES